MNNNFGDQDPMDQNTEVNVSFKEKKKNPSVGDGLFIADIVLHDKKMCLSQKFLVALVNNLDHFDQETQTFTTCFASNDWLSKILCIEKRQLQVLLAKSIKEGWIIRLPKKNGHRRLGGYKRRVLESIKNNQNSEQKDTCILMHPPMHSNAPIINRVLNTSTSPKKKNVIQNPPLGGGITSGVKTPVKQPRSGDRFLDKSFSKKEEKKGKPTPKAPKQRHMFQKARELLAEKKPLELLNKEQRAKAFGIAKDILKPMHDIKTGVKFHLGTSVNYVARGLIAGFEEKQIVERYRESLSERHADKPRSHKVWDLSSTVTLAFEKLIGNDQLTIRERYEKYKPLRKKDDTGESSLDWNEWSKQLTASANEKDA